MKLGQIQRKPEHVGPTTQIKDSRRHIQGPLPRILKRAQALKQKYMEGKRALIKRQLERQLISSLQNNQSFNPGMNEYYDHPSTSAPLTVGNARLETPIPPGNSAAYSEQMTQRDVPGFVEIAIPDQNAGVAKTVSGLAYSPYSDDLHEGLELGTSPSHSTQFFLSPIDNTGGSSLYRLRVPIIESASLEAVDHCTTFALSPPGPIMLKKCGDWPGFSQSFSYDSASGELQPVYDISPVDQYQSGRTAPPSRIFKRQVAPITKNIPQSVGPAERHVLTLSKFSAVLYFVPEGN